MEDARLNTSIEAAYQHGIEFSSHRAAVDAIVASMRDKNVVVEALTRDLLAASIRLELQSIRSTATSCGANVDEAERICLAFLQGASTIVGKEASA